MTHLFCIQLLFFISSNLFLVSYCNNEKQQNKTDVIILENQIVDHVAIRTILPENFLLGTVSIESDVFCDRDEFFYLMNIRENEIVAREDVVLGLERFSKKDRFLNIQLSVAQSPQGFNLFIKIVGRYSIKQITIEGIWHDLDTFKRLYLGQKFEPFDEKKHAEGMAAIREYFYKTGYCSAVVDDELLYDHAKKYITIRLFMKPGRRFKIETITLHCDAMSQTHEKLLTDIFEQYCSSKLCYQEYTHEQINKTFSLLAEQLRLHGFFGATIFCKEVVKKDTNTVSLDVSIKNVYHKRILFSGNQFFSSHALLDHIYTTFKNEQSITSDIVHDELLSLYGINGFFHVSVTERADDTEIVYKIVEQNQSIISQVVFSWLQITENIKTKYQLFLSQQLVGRPVNEITIKRALDLCAQELICDGFLGARIVEYRYEKLNTDTVILHVAIDAGKQIYIDDIIVQSDQEITGIKTDLFQLKKKSLVQMGLLSKQRDQLLFLLHNAGYLHAIVHPELREQPGNTLLIWQVVSGKRVDFGKIIILGNSIIPFRSIMRNIAFQTGELWQQNLIQQSLENLQKLSLYEHIEIYPVLYPTNKTHDLFLRLIPDDPFEVRLRAGTELQYIQDYQSFGGITYKMGGSFIAKNCFRSADTIQLDADFAGNHREVVLACNIPIVFPFIAVFPISNVWNAKMQAYHMRYAQPGVIGYPKNIYTVGRDGILCALCATKDASYLNMSWGFELQKTVIKNKRYADIIAHLINFDDHLLGKEVPYLFFETNCLFDFLDDKIYPTKGISSLFSLKYMLPCHGQSRYFAKLLYEQTCFVSLLTCTLGLRFRLGYMFHKDFSKISPMERFYLGGSHSMRGYEADLFPPTSPLVEESGKIVYIPRGGKIMININTELRKKLIQYVTFALFHDIGALADNIETMYAMVPLHTSGFGLRFDTPFGPLRFDIGWKWKLTHPDERRYAWYLSFGRSF